MLCAANCCARPSWATSVLATTSSPDVSLSMRWTMPGRATPPMPDRLSGAMVEQSIDQRAVAIAGRRDGRPCRPACRRRADARPRRRSSSAISCASLCAGSARGLRRVGAAATALAAGSRTALPCGSTRAAADQRLQPLARQRRQSGGERAVEPPAGMARAEPHIDEPMNPHSWSIWVRNGARFNGFGCRTCAGCGSGPSRGAR